jgi:hypothetical protein
MHERYPHKLARQFFSINKDGPTHNLEDEENSNLSYGNRGAAILQGP